MSKNNTSKVSNGPRQPSESARLTRDMIRGLSDMSSTNVPRENRGPANAKSPFKSGTGHTGARAKGSGDKL